MRTKALICAAAITVAGLANMQAQVYSVNVAGYVSLPLTNGLSLVNNPLDFDGTGTNNSLYTSIGTNVPSGTTVYAFYLPTLSYSNASYSSVLKKWGGSTNVINQALNPGKGVFIKIPSGVITNITFVGNVMQGALTNVIANSLQLIGSQVPQGGTISTNLGFVPANGDKVYLWKVPEQAYSSAFSFSTITKVWSPSQPQLNVGESAYLLGHAASKWTRNFTVQ